jgi:hypothetical protein
VQGLICARSTLSAIDFLCRCMSSLEASVSRVDFLVVDFLTQAIGSTLVRTPLTLCGLCCSGLCFWSRSSPRSSPPLSVADGGLNPVGALVLPDLALDFKCHFWLVKILVCFWLWWPVRSLDSCGNFCSLSGSACPRTCFSGQLAWSLIRCFSRATIHALGVGSSWFPLRILFGIDSSARILFSVQGS